MENFKRALPKYQRLVQGTVVQNYDEDGKIIDQKFIPTVGMDFLLEKGKQISFNEDIIEEFPIDLEQP